MRFLLVVSGRDSPSTRFRILQYIPLLERAGHRCDVAYSFPQKYDYIPQIGWRLSQLLKKSVRHWHAWLAKIRRYDAIVIEREVFDDDSIHIERRLRSATNRLVLDVDDGVFLLHPEKFDQLARMSDVAIAGNRYLAEYLQDRCRIVELIPTCVRLADYPSRPAEAQRVQMPCVGWIGNAPNVALLQVASQALREVARIIPFRLLVVAPSDEKLQEVDLTGVQVEFRKWSPQTEVSDILDMDLGLMPLPAGQEWMKYKCGLKLIQYLAVGIPGIASPIGVNEEILAGNHCGRAATHSADWTSALTELLPDAALRNQLGRAGRKLVEEQYSIEGNYPRFEKILTGQSA
jgi:glycosyltransferase involved in cell wall biosynthesis